MNVYNRVINDGDIFKSMYMKAIYIYIYICKNCIYESYVYEKILRNMFMKEA
jgi:hypothetical protein